MHHGMPMACEGMRMRGTLDLASKSGLPWRDEPAWREDQTAGLRACVDVVHTGYPAHVPHVCTMYHLQ